MWLEHLLSGAQKDDLLNGGMIRQVLLPCFFYNINLTILRELSQSDSALCRNAAEGIVLRAFRTEVKSQSLVAQLVRALH